MRKLCKGPPLDASCKVWVHLAMWFQRRRFLKYQPIRNKNCPWRPYLYSDQDEMRKLCKRLPLDASSKVWVYLAMWFQRRRFFKYQPIRNKNCPWRHICIPIQTKWGHFVKDLIQMLPVKFACIWPCGFRGEDFWNISQSETRIARGSHICSPIGTKWGNFVKDLP